ncbi:MAG TPA: GMC family oxidoreductase N-terminal domain-containing protein [Dongiaceae bacterium]|nr:GMC family oxidoreductase N-terminal domain-containing protein [Dongiaceae bacterium]
MAADPKREFDYVVVGAGSAGCVVAARLAEQADGSVLLVEAGPSRHGIRIDMPAAAYLACADAAYSWRYDTVAQRGLAGRTDAITTGRTVGGSSAINSLCYLRGHAEDFDRWEQQGAAGWRFASVLPYFKRSETRRPEGDPVYRGRGGPLVVTKARPHGPLQEAFLAAGASHPAGITEDPNGYRQEGFFACDQTIDRGIRASADRAFLRPVLRSKETASRLQILADGLVTGLRMEGARSAGITVARDGRELDFMARREVIVCAGAIRSPHLLMLSGIGPADHLRRHGIAVRADLPAVGAHLQDHVATRLSWRSLRPVSHSRYMRPDRKALAGLRWLLTGGGIGGTTGLEVGAMLRSSEELATPDLQFFLYPALVEGMRPHPSAHGFGIGVNLNRCSSTGTVRLASADPRLPPRIDPCYLSEAEDIERLRRGVELARAIVRDKAFERYRGPEFGESAPSSGDFAAWARRSVAGNWHPAGTCRMGAPDDGVTRPDGRVHGVDGLRVVDASLMPSITNANLNAPVIMMAERISDMICGRPLPADEPAPFHVHGPRRAAAP